MPDVRWFVNRLRAMGIREIMWRCNQQALQRIEKRRFGKQPSAVTERIYRPSLCDLHLHPERLYLNLANVSFSVRNSISLLGGYDYETYKKCWHAGFQTENDWPLKFSYSMRTADLSRRIGDVRTNWELNRHFQFAILAKDYAATGERTYLDELTELFDDWNKSNPFLWGISWTSPMEMAIRCSNWCYTYCFLAERKDVPARLMRQLETGIINMAAHIAGHYSRYSSANNHLIVEAYALGQAGILLGHKAWADLAVRLLTRELGRQNHADGVNKEQSLHYQAFSMEAIGLMARLLVKNGEGLPNGWMDAMKSNSRYLAACMGQYGEVVEFGDNDAGKILDLCGDIDHYRYVLELYSFFTDEKYTDMETCSENIYWLFSEGERYSSSEKVKYSVTESKCFQKGGNTILRGDSGRVLIGVDHAPLGFGSIAAHGHADALSFQMFADGHAVFIDPGTYLYSYDIDSRDAYRKTIAHNTVCVDERDQSEMLGPFLWGKKAESTLKEYRDEPDRIVLAAAQNGYAPVVHSREFQFDKKRRLIIKDTLSSPCKSTVNFTFGAGLTAAVEGTHVCFSSGQVSGTMNFTAAGRIHLSIVETMCSARYGEQEKTTALRVVTDACEVTTEIMIGTEQV